MTPERFGAEYRDTIHFVDNPLEENEERMRQLWVACTALKEQYERFENRYTALLESMEGLQKFIDGNKNQPWWKKILFSFEQKQAIQVAVKEAEAERDKLEKVLPGAEVETQNFLASLNNVLFILRAAEREWKARLNS